MTLSKSRRVSAQNLASSRCWLLRVRTTQQDFRTRVGCPRNSTVLSQAKRPGDSNERIAWESCSSFITATQSQNTIGIWDWSGGASDVAAGKIKSFYFTLNIIGFSLSIFYHFFSLSLSYSNEQNYIGQVQRQPGRLDKRNWIGPNAESRQTTGGFGFLIRLF